MKKTILGCFALLGCGITPSGDAVELDTKTIPARRGTVIADGCTLDEWQLETLQSTFTKKILSEIVLECLVPHSDGSVTPADASGKSDLDALVTRLRQWGYRVSLGVSFVTDDGYTFDGNQTANELTSNTWVASVVANVTALATNADGVDLDFEQLPAKSQPDVTRFVGALAASVHPQKKQLGVFLPPSIQTPSDVPGGDAFDVLTLSSVTDRFRVMTLDFSGSTAGPTIDTGWAIDAIRFAQKSTGGAGVDVAFPLYGNDFTTSSPDPPRLTTFLEAQGISSSVGVPAHRSPSRELVLDWRDEGGASHELWYDDADSTLVALVAWDPTTLPTSVGVVFYGFGAEDPALWNTLAKAMP